MLQAYLMERRVEVLPIMCAAAASEGHLTGDGRLPKAAPAKEMLKAEICSWITERALDSNE